MMNSKNKLKEILKQLYQDPNNSQCFDCDNQPAHWASVNNGIYLCLDCSGEHRGFGVAVSFIKSVTLDQWNENQVNLMKLGGNLRLKNFLISHNMPDYIDKQTIYSSKLMSHYRKMLKCEASGQLFMEPEPPMDKYWELASKEDDNFNNNNNYSNNLFSKNYNNSMFNNTNNNQNKNNNSINIPNYSSNNNNNYYDSYNNNNNNNDYYRSDFPKREIVINEDQYQKARYYAEQSKNYEVNTSIPSEPKFKYTNPIYKNDSRFASIGSEPIDNSAFSSGDGYLGTFGNILGNVWNTGVNVASTIKDKMNEYDVGNKLVTIGGAAVSAIAYTGGKIIEKSSEAINSETAQNLASKVGEGLSNIKNKITGNNDTAFGGNKKYISDSKYSSTSSDSYYDNY